MRKLCSLLVIGALLLMAGFVLAGEEAKEPTQSTGKTVFTNIAVRGTNYDKSPGYIELFSASGASTENVYYLWVGQDGKLRISSSPVVGYIASPTWAHPWEGTSGTVVGVQS